MDYKDIQTDEINAIYKFIEENAQHDDLIEELILDKNENYKDAVHVVLEKIIDGTLSKKHLQTIISLQVNSLNWDDFQILLEIGVMDGNLELSDIKSGK